MTEMQQGTEDALTNMLYFTSDGLAFFDQQAAERHAGKLADTEIVGKTSEQVRKEIDNVTNEQWDNEMQQLIDDLSE